MPGRHLDASDLLFEIGRQVQALALVMRRHEIVPAQQLCECGRLALRILPVFGLRCDIACDQWDLAHGLMRRLLEHMTDRSTGNGINRRAVGRATVPSGGADALACDSTDCKARDRDEAAACRD